MCTETITLRFCSLMNSADSQMFQFYNFSAFCMAKIIDLLKLTDLSSFSSWDHNPVLISVSITAVLLKLRSQPCPHICQHNCRPSQAKITTLASYLSDTRRHMSSAAAVWAAYTGGRRNTHFHEQWAYRPISNIYTYGYAPLWKLAQEKNVSLLCCLIYQIVLIQGLWWKDCRFSR
jgi:hypothetical protein